MMDRRRFARRREKPELLGLSTLDTVSCALAGAIVLMIVMAATTPSTAKVELTPVREIFQSGAGTGGKDENPSLSVGKAGGGEVHNLAVLFLDFDRPIALKPRLETQCARIDALSDLGSAGEHFRGEAPRKTHALVVWAEPVRNGCTKLMLWLDYEDGPSGCDVTLVSGGHYQQLRKEQCRNGFDLYALGDGVLQFKRGQ